ncbi:unnamed protein product [Durusdinium trenchii]|uniref:Uncharacterized protein n=1 Tax=Durusdinium trenchii TaxID=1381693 RepID=A0ABP0MVE2_9DINO
MTLEQQVVPAAAFESASLSLHPLKMVKGKSKGSKGGSSYGGYKVRTSFVKTKPVAWTEPSKGSRKGGTKGKGGKGGGGKWIWVETEAPARRPMSKGGKKGKGKRRAPALTSEFWTKKVEEESRKELGETAYPGVIQRYNVRQGWGLIRPDNLAGLPGQVKKKIQEAETKVEESGKEVTEKGLLYFRKPDVNHTDGFKLTSDVPVTFRIYVDDKGAGAMDVSMA